MISYLKIIFALSGLFVLTGSHTYGQFLRPLVGNPKLKGPVCIAPEYKSKTRTTDTLELPFLDDFSQSLVFPDFDLWADRYVYVNQSMAIDPPTIGVATFDAIDQYGEFHVSVLNGGHKPADTLTSQPLNLAAPNDQDVYLSFYYQPQGELYYPSAKDSLMLDFLDVENQEWDSVWSVAGSSVQPFKAVIIPINKRQYLQKGFRFRFRNYVSIDAGMLSEKINTDFWHIDYVYLDDDRSADDTIMHDLAFTENLGTVLKDYTSVPWLHYKDQAIAAAAKFQASYRNNDDIARTLENLRFELIDRSGSSSPVTIQAGGHNIMANELVKDREIPAASFYFPSNENDTASFELRGIIVTSGASIDAIPENDTVSYIHTFDNYYAYDDGQPEFNFGLYGQGTSNAKLAYQFDINGTYELSGVSVYFAESAYSQDRPLSFVLRVWDDDNGLPGDTLYFQTGYQTSYSGGLNQYQLYRLKTSDGQADTSIMLSGRFYIGFQNTSEESMNIGFDTDNNAKSKIFYNIDGSWYNIYDDGALMLRPVFGALPYSNISERAASRPLSVYPNPASDLLTISYELKEKSLVSLSIYNLLGQKEIQWFEGEYQLSGRYRAGIPVGHLESGLYIYRLSINGRQQQGRFVKR